MKVFSNKKFKIFIYLLLVVTCFGYLKYKSSFASYETNITGNINPRIAKWSILVNGVETTGSEGEVNLDFDSVDWVCPGGVRAGKIGPGCYGDIELIVEAANTEVAVLYEFDIVDKTVVPEKILRITNMTFSNSNFKKTGETTYSGYLSLDDIKNNPTLTLTMDVVWEDDGDIVYDEQFFTNDDNYITIDFFAKQYLGEEIIPYNE